MIVYIGSPIDTSLEPPHETFELLGQLTVEAISDVVIFNPLTAYINAINAKTKDARSFIVQMNFEALKRADAALFAWNKSPSYGVPVEIEFCYMHDIPFVIWNRSDKALGIYAHHAVDNASKATIVNNKEAVVSALKEIKEISTPQLNMDPVLQDWSSEAKMSTAVYGTPVAASEVKEL